MLCTNCNRKPAKVKGLCITCYRYQLQYHQPRPERLFKRILGRHHKLKPKGCRNCGNPKIRSNLRCNSCYLYWRKHGKNRPRYLWDKETHCLRCNWTLKGDTKGYRGCCGSCTSYLSRHKLPFPPRK